MTKQAQAQALQTKLSIFELAAKLSAQETVELKAKESLTITSIDMADFLAIVNEEDLGKKLGLLQQVLARFGFLLQLEGAVVLGNLNLDDRSWTVSASENASLKISSRPLPMKIALSDLVTFLKKLPIGQGLVFKANQDLTITGFSEQAVVNYFELSQSTQDPRVLETTQDQFFIQSNETLAKEGLCLKMFAMEAKMLNREVNPAFGVVSFRPQGDETLTQPKMIAALVKQGE